MHRSQLPQAFLLIGIALAGVGGGTQARAQAGPLPGLDKYIVNSLAQWNVAGLAIAVVKDDSVVFARGFGVREMGSPAPVDAATVFSIGSMTKFFTAVAVGMMVDDGKMDWDEPLQRYLPGFEVGDPWVTRHLTVRDALSHRTGLDWRLDFLWLQTDLGRDEVLARLRSFEPEPGFRTGYGYSNVMFSAAGEAAAHAAGTTWEDLIRTRIFAPLGMRSSLATLADLPPTGNLAVPHVNFRGAPQPIRRVGITNIPAAGAINSTALDMAQWLRFVLAGGRRGTTQLIAPKTLGEILSPQVIVGAPDSLLARFVNFNLYGLGVEILDYKGHKLIEHAGRVDGMISRFAVIPDQKLGVVVLSNTSGAAGLPPELPEALVYRVLDTYLGGLKPDWSAEFLAERHAALGRRAAGVARADSSRVPNTKPSLPLAAYAGRYTGPIGSAPLTATERAELVRGGPFATVTVDNGALRLKVGPIEGALEHWHYDTFRVYWDVIGYLYVHFILDNAGKAVRVQIDFAGDFERAD